MTRRPALFAAFALSGVAGLVYEAVWGRYLGLFVGHSAYAQVLVLTVYLGGMAVGALAVGDATARLTSPLTWYVRAEVALAALGFAFHPVFRWVTGLSYEVIFPALPGAAAAGAVRWGIAALLLLPQALVLGTTFPLMAAALVRGDAGRPGRGVATVYLVNTLGGALGVLLAGFWLVGAVGLAGTVMAAACLNLAAAALAGWARAGARPSAEAAGPSGDHALGSAPAPVPGSLAGASGLVPLLLAVSALTAVASFAYEIGWIRMLSLVLGSATHAFELMLSAFLLGLAGGAWLIRARADRSDDPLRTLGGIQVLMGVAAVATLPLYAASFPVMAWLVRSLPAREDGYLLFNLGRYALCLAVMLPSTLMAGMTLPVITGTLLRAGRGEASIGRVYGVNTIGSVLGSGLAGLVALPALGLKGLLMAGAVLDVALGIWLLERAARWGGRTRRAALTTAGLSGVVFVLVAWGIRLDERLLTSGVFRYGQLPEPGANEPLFYRDGRTATVSAHLALESRTVVLSTNGKPDASLGARWFDPGRDTLPDIPLEAGQDFTTQVLAPLVGLAHAPHARSVANIGHGSGMTGAAFLTSPSLERLVTIEIEPEMVEGSFVFLPVNQAVFDDPRSTFAFDDAKSFFAYGRERFDIVFAEPSNPWVSGTASLFTAEFYRRVRDYLAEGGVLVQWMQIYEISDDLVLSVVSALDAAFPSYRAYLVGDADVVIVAGSGPALREPDWSVLEAPGVRAMTQGIPPIRAEHMASLLLFDQRTFRPILDAGVEANSDYRPLLDLGAERARFMGWRAEGLFSMAANRLDLRRMLAEEPQLPLPFAVPPARGLGPALDWGRGAWLREAMSHGGAAAPLQYLDWTESLVSLRNFLGTMQTGDPAEDWQDWASAFDRAERDLHWGTAGWVDTTFYRIVDGYLDRTGAPPQARAAAALLHGASLFDWDEAADAADVLVGPVALGERWARPTVLLDVAAVAYLKTGRTSDARRALDLLGPRTGRAAWNLRTHLLEVSLQAAGLPFSPTDP